MKEKIQELQDQLAAMSKTVKELNDMGVTLIFSIDNTRKQSTFICESRGTETLPFTITVAEATINQSLI